MLMRLGSVEFDLKVNPQSLSFDAEHPFATHEVMGTSPIHENMGDGNETYEIKGVVHPHHFGGLDGLVKLKQARARGVPVPFMRGNLTPKGWVLLTKLNFTEEELGPGGVGMVINFNATLVSTGRPSANMAQFILGLFI